MKIVVFKDASIQVKNDSDGEGDYNVKLFVPGDVVPIEDVTEAVLSEIKAGRCPHLVLVDDDDVKREALAAAASDHRNGDVVITEAVLSSEELEVAYGEVQPDQDEIIDLAGQEVIVSAAA